MPRWLLCILTCVFAVAASAQENEKANTATDPFLQVTGALPGCPQQVQTQPSPAELQAQAHWRAERGTSCYQAGRCRLPNAYLYDAEIIPRVKKAILADGRFATTSVWAEGQRRWVWLTGCVSSAEQATQIEQLVRNIDDVEGVINALTVWPP